MKPPKSTCCAMVTLRIREEHDLPAVWQALAALQALTRQESGCLRFDLFQFAEKPDALLLIEEFVDAAAFSRHLQAPYTQAYFSLAMTEVVEKTPLLELKIDVAG
ncbi:putative quinol monooxygenase [Azonexus sp.]|uniref:putative quinol monooxygenase n=1 Tax=Azonexus sp. TaxID=1872668 RepID=UPI0027BA1558|nr:putative quinol monooxygenase [Azonexus sp.]